MRLTLGSKPDLRCTCDSVPPEEHTCPYQCEINDDEEYTCSCCEFCTQECADDI